MLLGKRKVSALQEQRHICDFCWMNPRLTTRERLWYCHGRVLVWVHDPQRRMKDHDDRVFQWAIRMEAEAPDCICLQEFLYLMAEGRA